jgi:hypothetical protein
MMPPRQRHTTRWRRRRHSLWRGTAVPAPPLRDDACAAALGVAERFADDAATAQRRTEAMSYGRSVRGEVAPRAEGAGGRQRVPAPPGKYLTECLTEYPSRQRGRGSACLRQTLKPNEQTNKQTIKQTNKRTNKQTSKQTPAGARRGGQPALERQGAFVPFRARGLGRRGPRRMSFRL